MRWHLDGLEVLMATTWQTLEEAGASDTHPFRTPALATASNRGPSVRAVVLRRAERAQRTLMCFTDARTTKVRHVSACRRVEWLFFDPAERVQLRAAGVATVHRGDVVARAAWEQTPLASRLNYCATSAPGTEIATPDASLPVVWRERLPTAEETERGWSNFAVILTTVDRLDWLQLAEPLHHRAVFTWDGERFVGQWVVP
ncbi:MAG: pyridoxamine 5'-phosphate oxidase family protein [Verrucomicrobia bacterium]|nr:pyridoxamine 5'-phosphate oxidase family protein [Verrucomicrobiota bacterium]